MLIINKLIKMGIIKKEDTDIYEYSINILKNYIFFLLIVFICNLITKNMINTILFLSLFFTLRRYCGGIHFNNSLTCIIVSVLFSVLVPLSCRILILHGNTILLFQSICSLFIVICPIVDNPNKVVSKENKKYYKRKSIVYIILYLVLSFILLFFQMKEKSMIILLVLISTLVTSWLGYFKYRLFI